MSNEFQLAEAYAELTIHGENAFTAVLGRVKKNVTDLGKHLEGMGRAASRVLLAATGSMTLFVKMAADAEQSGRKLDAVLKATGRSELSGELKKYAGDLQKVTKFEDDATISAMALLATFKSIDGSMMKKATMAAMDMSTVFGGDLQSNIRLVGLALENPTEGITRLQRVGVSFSEQQKTTIKSLVEGGQSAKAQGMMLDLLAAKMSGAALAAGKTFSGQLMIMKNQLGDLAEEIGSALFPVLSKLASAISSVVDRMSGLTDVQKGAIATWTIFGGAMLAVVAILPKIVAGINGVVTLMATLGGASGPVLLVVGAIALLGAAWLTASAKGQGFVQTLVEMAQDVAGLDNVTRQYLDSLEKTKRLEASGKQQRSDIAAGAVQSGKPEDIDASLNVINSQISAEMARQRNTRIKDPEADAKMSQLLAERDTLVKQRQKAANVGDDAAKNKAFQESLPAWARNPLGGSATSATEDERKAQLAEAMAERDAAAGRVNAFGIDTSDIPKDLPSDDSRFSEYNANKLDLQRANAKVDSLKSLLAETKSRGAYKDEGAATEEEKKAWTKDRETKSRTRAMAATPFGEIGIDIGSLSGMIQNMLGRAGEMAGKGAGAVAQGQRASAQGVLDSFADKPLQGITEALKRMKDDEERAAFNRMNPSEKLDKLKNADAETIAKLTGREMPKEEKSGGGGTVSASELNAKMQAAADKQADEQIKIAKDSLKKAGDIEKAIKGLPSQINAIGQVAWQ
jgi:hypothetical protein